MNSFVTRGLFVTGTDTGVGKTWVTSLIARELRALGRTVGISKPVCSGAEIDEAGKEYWPDVETHFEALEGEFPRELICPHCFREPLAPPVAARIESKSLSFENCVHSVNNWRERVEFLLVEGVGGFLCPLTERETIADFASELQLPVLVVAHLGLGTLNHTLLTLEAIQSRDLGVAGILLNQISPPEGSIAEQTNPDELTRRTDVPILGLIEYQQRDPLRQKSGASTMDWFALAGPMR